MIENIYSEGTIIGMKLISGEEIVGRVEIHEDMNSIVLSKIRVMVVHQQGVAFIPYIMSVDDHKELRINFDKVVVHSVVVPEVENGFIEATSNIKIVK